MRGQPDPEGDRVGAHCLGAAAIATTAFGLAGLGVRALRRRRHRGPRTDERPGPPAAPDVGLDDLAPESILRIAYQLLLNREPDPSGIATHVEALRSGERSPRQIVEWMTSSREWQAVNRRTELGPALQVSRSAFVQSLPRAKRILDLGGTGLQMPEGALVAAFRYPYDFDELVIVDLPPEDRHQIYRDGAQNNRLEIPQGTVTYRYHSMTDLSGIGSGSFDLVYMGQAIEHVSTDEADHVLAQVHRVLCGTGHLALDTPNARVTRLQQAAFVDPDHKYEYTHEEMAEKLAANGFEILEAKGLNYAGKSLESNAFSIEEVASHPAMYAEIVDCYLLSYLCRPVPDR